MAQLHHYSPRIDRFLVACLYHEAKRRRVPMTRLVDELLVEALRDTDGWKSAQSDPALREKMQTRHLVR